MNKFIKILGYFLSGSAIALPVALLHVYAISTGKYLVVIIGMVCFMSYMIGLGITIMDMEIKIRELKSRIKA